MKRSDAPWAEALVRRRWFRLRLFALGAAAGVAAGLTVSLYRFLIGQAESCRAVLAAVTADAAAGGQYLPALAWAAGLLILAFLLAALCRWEPMASGSGIPQVKGALLGLFRLRWLRILCVQIFGGALAIGAGLSLGHAGPAVEIGAASAQGVSRAAARDRTETQYLLTGGAGAGLAAVFNAPLTGMLFALEELHHQFSAAVILPAMAAAVTAACTVQFFFGPGTVFLFSGLHPLPPSQLLWAVPLAMVCGAAAVLFNQGLLSVRRFYGLPCFRRPEARIAFALACAALAVFFCPSLTGGGESLINAVTALPPAFPVLLTLLLGKALFTFLSFGSGVPGGFFFPSLTVGALTGAAFGSLLTGAGLLPPEAMPDLILLAMAAFFAGSVRAPITGAVLLLEMTGRFDHLLPLALVTAISYVTSGLLGGVPIYEALLRRQTAERQNPAEEEGHLTTLLVESGSPLTGRSAASLPLPPHTVLVSIRRNEMSIVPDPSCLIREGDQLLFFTQQPEAGLLYWLKDTPPVPDPKK